MKSLGVLVITVLSVMIGVAVGLVTAFMLLMPLFELFTCGTFWDQGCGTHHNLMLFGSLAASGLGGIFAGWAAAKLFKKLVTKLQRP